MPGLQVESLGWAIVFMMGFIALQVIYWWLFIHFFSYLPALLYPVFSMALAVGGLVLFGNWISGLVIADFWTGFWITMVLTASSVILSGILSLDLDRRFDRQVTRRLIRKHGKPVNTDEPGILFLEIDGLSECVFRKALHTGKMPTMKRWLEEGSHTILGWETDFSSQTGAIQSAILLGSNDNIPAYRWWDRKLHRVIRSGSFRDAAYLETKLSRQAGLLAGGGTSRSNVFSGDAKESMFTISTVLDQRRARGPRLYLYLINPFIIVRLVIDFIYAVLRELIQSIMQKIRREEFRVRSRNLLFALSRAAECQILQAITTYLIIADILRGVPAIYATYPGYDSIGHYSGVETKEAFDTLEEIDQYFARIEHVIPLAPRPYHIIILSDHGLSNGGTFNNAHGITLEQLVRGLVKPDSKLYVPPDADESWDKVKAFLSDSLNKNKWTTRILETMLHSKEDKSLRKKAVEESMLNEDAIVVIGSGCTGLVYFTEARERLTYEVIQNRFPDLIPNLVNHPGIGFVLVRSQEVGDMVLGKRGIYYLDSDIVDGKYPLADYSPHAAALLRHESSFSNCSDILVNTSYDPVREVLTGFEDQVGHHGGLGGPQSFPFIFHPVHLPQDNEPLVGAIQVHQLLSRWRYGIEGKPGEAP